MKGILPFSILFIFISVLVFIFSTETVLHEKEKKLLI